jgi:hypothetical protein
VVELRKISRCRMRLTILVIRRKASIDIGHNVVEGLNQLWFCVDHIRKRDCLLRARLSKGLNVIVALVWWEGLRLA